MKKEIITASPGETIAAAKKFAKTLKPGQVIALEGGLGSGKTISKAAASSGWIQE